MSEEKVVEKTKVSDLMPGEAKEGHVLQSLPTAKIEIQKLTPDGQLMERYSFEGSDFSGTGALGVLETSMQMFFAFQNSLRELEQSKAKKKN